jgi:hypothetical protein
MRMKRTTIYLDTDLEVRLKLESLRSGRPAADVIRVALETYLKDRRPGLPEGIGAFDSGHTDTAERFDEILDRSGFGED